MKLKRFFTVLLILTIALLTVGFSACSGSETYTVTFNADGGTVSVASKEVILGEKIGELPVPAKDGYEFVNWVLPASVENGADVKIDANRVYNWEKDITLKAVWKKLMNVSFDFDGGTASVTSKQLSQGSALGELPTPTKEDYTFVGWILVGGGENGSDLTVNSTTTYSWTEDITLKAVWRKVTMTVSFDLDGGVMTSEPKKVNQGEQMGELPTPTKGGYAFNGWVLVGGGENGADLTVDSTTTYSWADDITLKAIWNEVITISFDLTGGSYDGGNVITPITVEKTKPITLPDSTKLAKTDSRFHYWAYEGQEIEDNQICEFTENVTLTAVWIPADQYIIRYDLKGGTCNGLVDVYNDTMDDFTLPTPIKDRYEFLGWSGTGIDGTSKTVTIDTSSAKDKAFVANWKLLSYAVTVDLGSDGTPSYDGEEAFLVNYGLIISNKISTPTNENQRYEFKYWYVMIDGVETQIDLANDVFNSDKFGELDELVFKAKWEKTSVKVNVVIGNDGSPVYSGDMEFFIKYDTKISDKISTPTNENPRYEFKYWYVIVNGTETQIDLASDKFNSEKFLGVEDFVITAKWDERVLEVQSYAVTLNLRIDADDETSLLFPYDLDPDTDGIQISFIAEKGKTLGYYIKKDPTAFKEGYNNCNFLYWKIKNADGSYTKIDSNTVFNEANFGTDTDITLYMETEIWLGPF